MSNIVHQQFVSSFGANHFQFAICLLNPTCVNFSVFATASGVYPEIYSKKSTFCEVLPRNALK